MPMNHYCTCPTCGNRHRISDLTALEIESEKESKINRLAMEIHYREGCPLVQAVARACSDLGYEFTI
ncbi:MAG: hypothetical protein RBT11_14245 [Desulfobacterales bacterium]|nr:hypothetical protein [Desulfobacterales bacterium]